MTEEEIRILCATVLHGQRVEDFVAVWDFPGFLGLQQDNDEDLRVPAGEGGFYAPCLIAMPDMLNGEPNRITFCVDLAGYQIALLDEDVTWEPETALATWRVAVEKRLPLVREIFGVIRERGLDGFIDLTQRHDVYEGGC